MFAPILALNCLALEVAIEVAAFYRLAFVIFFLAFAGGDDELDIATAGEEANGDDLEAILLSAGKLSELAFGDEELEILGGIRAESEIIQP